MARRRAKGSLFRPTVIRTKRGRKVRERTRFYWARYRDECGQIQCHVLTLPNGDRVTDSTVAESELRKILHRVERAAAGLVDRAVESASMPMRTVLARYVRHLRGRRLSRKHIEQVLTVGRFLIERTGALRLADFTEERVDRALGLVADAGRSPRTVNVYRSRLFSLGEWALTVARVLDRNPVAAVAVRDEAADVRKERRALTVDQARELLRVTGPRRLFYMLQLYSGLRVGETRALEWRDVDLDGERPYLALRAAATKSKRADVVPIHPSLAEDLRDARPESAEPTDRVFGSVPILRTLKGGWVKYKGERRYQQGDLDRAGIPFADEQGRTVDLHSLRTTFVSWLGQCGVDPRAQMRLARHAPTGITLRHYQDFGLFDLWAEIAKLPDIRPSPNAEAVRATGTYGDGKARSAAPRKINKSVASPVALRGGLKGGNVAASGRMDRASHKARHSKKTSFSPGKNGDFEAETALGDTRLELVTSCVSSIHSRRKPAFQTPKTAFFA